MTVLMVGWFKLSRGNEKPNAREVSVIIPFRNEAENLRELCNSLGNIRYPKDKVEFIFVDDYSTDNGVELLEQLVDKLDWKIKVLKNESQIGKKVAIENGIKNASFGIIVTLDADSRVNAGWLEAISKTEGDLVIGPVVGKSGKGFIKRFQEIELLMLSGIAVSAAGVKLPVLCSGANLCYRKEVFNQLQPYKNNREVLSGDDMFLLKSMVDGGKHIEATNHPEALVETETENSWKELFNRAKRWSGKSGKVKLFTTNVIGLIVMLANLISLALLVIYLFNPGISQIIWILPVSKFVFDFLFLFLMVRRYRKSELLLFAPLMVITYPIYLVVVVLYSFGSSSVWKGREITAT